MCTHARTIRLRAMRAARAPRWLTGDMAADRALYGVVGESERTDTCVARARDATDLTPRESMLLRGTDDEAARRFAMKRARVAYLPADAMPSSRFRVGWLQSSAPDAREPRAVDIPWHVFVNALRVRTLGARRILREDGAAVRVERSGTGAATKCILRVRDRRSGNVTRFLLPRDTSLEPTTEVRRFATYARRPANPKRFVLVHVDAAGGAFERVDENLPHAEIVTGAAAAAAAAEDDAAWMPEDWFTGGDASALAQGFPHYDALLWFGVTCAFERDLPFVVRSGRAVVRLLFPWYDADPLTRHADTGEVECVHACQLVFLQLECGSLDPERGPSTVTLQPCVRVPARLRIGRARVDGVTVAIPGVPAFRFAIEPLAGRAAAAAAAAAATGATATTDGDGDGDDDGDSGARRDDDDDDDGGGGGGGGGTDTSAAHAFVSMTFIGTEVDARA